MWDDDRCDQDYSDREFRVLQGLTLESVENRGSDEIVFKTVDGREFAQHHHQDCCESVRVEDICGDLEDLVGAEIVEARAASSHELDGDYGDSSTWTFYTLRTIKGTVTIRWHGSSNGYYSESVSFEERTKED